MFFDKILNGEMMRKPTGMIAIEVLSNLGEPISITQLEKNTGNKYLSMKKILNRFQEDEIVKAESEGHSILYSLVTKNADRIVSACKAFSNEFLEPLKEY